ncbi:hypothetical protein bcere0022_37380 [Bacillus cereus Rock3-44]|nr:hypothetical protein bcere0022_37380 [Bacillus cereus Rock3-44]
MLRENKDALSKLSHYYYKAILSMYKLFYVIMKNKVRLL